MNSAISNYAKYLSVLTAAAAFALPAFAQSANDQNSNASTNPNETNANGAATTNANSGVNGGMDQNGNANANVNLNGNGNTGNRPLAHMDRRFFDKAAESGTNEVALSQLAADHSSNPQVKEFAEMMINDHTKLNNRLSDLASQVGVDLSEYIQKGQKDDVDSLRDKNGADFDKAYLDEMISSHKDTADLFEKEATDSRNPELGRFAVNNLSTILVHLRHAQALYRRINGND